MEGYGIRKENRTCEGPGLQVKRGNQGGLTQRGHTSKDLNEAREQANHVLSREEQPRQRGQRG